MLSTYKDWNCIIKVYVRLPNIRTPPPSGSKTCISIEVIIREKRGLSTAISIVTEEYNSNGKHFYTELCRNFQNLHQIKLLSAVISSCLQVVHSFSLPGGFRCLFCYSSSILACRGLSNIVRTWQVTAK